MPNDKKIQDEYNKPLLNALQNIHELDEYDLEYIKKAVLKDLQNDVDQKTGHLYLTIINFMKMSKNKSLKMFLKMDLKI